MKNLKLSIVIIFVAFIFYACDEDDKIIDQPPKIPLVWVSNTDIDSVKFKWSCEDPDGDDLVYDFFYSTSNPPIKKLSKSSDTEYVVGGRLQANTRYYYKVIAYDEDNYSSESPVKNFTTGSAWAQLQSPPENPFPGQLWRPLVGLYREPMDFVYIPPGSFMMGATDNDTNARDSEKPRHLVTIENGFWMGQYEMSTKQFGACTSGDYQNERYEFSPMAYLNLSETAGINSVLHDLNLNAPGSPWRLPTEAEWEYACRAGTETIYFWGDDTEGYEDYVLCNADTLEDPIPEMIIGTKSPNPWGLYDMLGNVGEWTADTAPPEYWEGEGYVGAPTDGSAWNNYPDSDYYVLRGGYIGFSIEECRCSSRNRAINTSLPTRKAGLRLVIDPTRYYY